MTSSLVLSPPREAAESSPRRFDNVTIALHWTTLLLILGMFASAWAYSTSNDSAQSNLTLAIHRSLGVAVWTVTLARLFWRRRFASIPALPADMPRIQQMAAKANEYGLYALLLIQPLTGMAQSLTRGRPFPIFGLDVPKLMAKDRDLTAVFHAVHEVSAWVLVGLIGTHALAALFHRFVLKDDVLQSMTPLRRPAEPNL